MSFHLGAQGTFKGTLQLLINRDGSIRFARYLSEFRLRVSSF